MEIDFEVSMKRSYCSIGSRSIKTLWIILLDKYIKMKYEHPWVWLEMALEANNMTQKEFADLIWKNPVEVNQIINWKKNITLDWAMKISAVFGWNYKMWLDMQADYDEQEYRRSKKYLEIKKIQERARQIISQS